MPRIALEDLKLIKNDDLIGLIGKNLEHVLSFLRNTTYGEDADCNLNVAVEHGLLEDTILQNYVKTFNRIYQNSSKYIKNLLTVLLHKFDALNLKTMMRMIHAGINTEEILQNIIPLGEYTKAKCHQLLSCVASVSDFVQSLQTEDFGFFLKETFKDQMIFTDLTPLEAALDKEVTKGILKAIKKLDRLDKKIATNILGIEIDAMNVKIILKCKALGVDQEKIKENLMPGVMFDEKILESAIQQPDITSALQEFLSSIEMGHQVYKKIFEKLVTESECSISELEMMLDKASLEMSLFELKTHLRYYSIGYILAFLNLKWTEMKNVRSLINASARKLPDQTIDLLILPEHY